tara:strand:- start:1544 stop:2158 length:615 start_codon:yes stop_codon:yes gene_type:complete
MIRMLSILILLSSCGNLPIAYLQNFSSVNNVVFGFPEYEITEEIYDDFDNSFMKIRFGRGPHAILILAYTKDGVYEWVGADDVKIFTLNGRIIKTSGLPSNFEIIKPLEKVYYPNQVFEGINLFDPDLFSATLERSMKIDTATITKLENAIEVSRIQENFSLDIIGWKGVNTYYQNPSSNLIEASEQMIHPRLPVAKVEFYFKY